VTTHLAADYGLCSIKVNSVLFCHKVETVLSLVHRYLLNSIKFRIVSHNCIRILVFICKVCFCICRC
jgi:hypothetical protein